MFFEVPQDKLFPGGVYGGCSFRSTALDWALHRMREWVVEPQSRVVVGGLLGCLLQSILGDEYSWCVERSRGRVGILRAGPGHAS